MIFTTSLLTFCLLQLSACHPTPQKINISGNSVYYPSEVNSLQSDNPVSGKKSRTIEDTIKEVESLIRNDPTLPRLTKGEIVDILNNITRSDLERQKRLLRTKEREQKALMLVMPYTPNQNNGETDIQHLYTKPPITRIIGDADKSTTKAPSVVRRKRPTLATIPPEDHHVEHKKETQIYKISSRAPTRSATRSTTPPPTLDVLNGKIPEMTESTPSKSVQRRRRPQTATTPRAISSTTVTKVEEDSPIKHPNHKYPEEVDIPSKYGMKVVGAPDLGPSQPIPSKTPHRENDLAQYSGDLSSITAKPVMVPTTYRPILADINLPEELRLPLRDYDLGIDERKNTIKYSSQYDSSNAHFPSPFFNKDSVNDILKSIGAIPATTTRLPDISHVADNLSPDMKELLNSFGLIYDDQPHAPVQETYLSPEPTELTGASYVQFRPLPDDVGAGDEMDHFLSQFGLGRSARSSTKESKKSESFPKKEKVLTEVPDFEPEMLPSNMKEVLTDIGLTDRQGRKIESASQVKILEKSPVVDQVKTSKLTSSKQHVFNPSNSSYASNEDLEKLSQLIDTIKQLEKLNRTVTEDDLNPTQIQNIKDLVNTLKDNSIVPLDEQVSGLNPLVFDVDYKQTEAKRQKNQADVATTTETAETMETVTTSRIETTTGTAATEETNTPNLKDLEDSFGGSSNKATETVAVLPPPSSTPRTGFYYLLDWNSFLDIDDQNGRRVNLRFQPKVGDPKRFYSVTVP